LSTEGTEEHREEEIKNEKLFNTDELRMHTDGGVWGNLQGRNIEKVSVYDIITYI